MASESGGWLNHDRVRAGRCCGRGVVGFVFSDLPVWATVRKDRVSRGGLGWPTVEGESPVGENMVSVVMGFPE